MKKMKSVSDKKRRMPLRLLPFAAFLLIVAGFIAWSNTFQVPFQWDDIPQVVKNKRVHDIAFFGKADTWMNVNLRPLSLFTLSLNWAVGEKQVAGYHLVNLLLHIFTAFLVFLLARHSIGLLRNDKRLEHRYRDPLAVVVALIFLLHPLQTMAVTYIIQRMTVLAALFYISSLLLYARGRAAWLTGGRKGRAAMLLALALLSGVLAVLSKQNAITFPAAFLLYELFFIRKKDGTPCRKYIAAGFSLIILPFLAVVVAGKLPAETDKFTRLEYFSAQLGILYKYILLVLFPIRQNADYFIRIEPPLFGAAQYAGILLLIALAVLGVVMFRRNRLVSFGIFWFLLSMSVESGIIPIRDIMMEHRMYLPLFGVVMIAAGLVIRHVPYRSRTGMYTIAAMLIVLLAAGTYSRNRVWQSDLALWQDSLDKNPENPRAMNNLGLAIKVHSAHAPGPLQREQELRRAIGYFNNSMKGDTVFVQAYLNRGLSYFELGQYEKALDDVRIVGEKKPDKRYLFDYIQGVSYAKQGYIKAAGVSFDKAARLNDDFAPLYMWRGLITAEMEQYEKALENFLFSLKLEPEQPLLYVNVSNMYFYLRNFDEALRWIRKAEAAGITVDYEYVQKLMELVNGKQ
jgi:tetratricopeptide (TPR) repeat protein